MIGPQEQRPEPREVELFKDVEEPSAVVERARPVGLWIAVAGLIAAAVVAAYLVFGGRDRAAPESTTARQPAAAAQSPSQPLGGTPESIAVPPLDETDPLVRQLVNQIASHPRIADWLATNGLLRNFSVVVANVAEGATPARHLRGLRPSSSFAVVERGEGLIIDPASYHRYDALAAAVASIDPAGAARVYATLKPRIQEAYREVGDAGVPFDRVLENAIVRLLSTPRVADPIRVRPHGAFGYGFDDPALEALTPAQKQLLRTGPENTRLIQTSLRAIALALGVPAERLPATTTP